VGSLPVLPSVVSVPSVAKDAYVGDKSLATEYTEYTERGKLVGSLPVLHSVVSVPSVAGSSFCPEKSLATEITEGTEVRVEGLIVCKR